MRTVLARTLLLASASVFPALAGNQILLRNFNAADGTPKVLASGANGLFVISTLASGNQQISRLVQLDLTGTRLASLDIPQLNAPTAAAVDAQGNVIVVGLAQTLAGIVVKIGPQLQTATTLASLPAGINAVALDSAGDIYLTGVTNSDSFPVTTGAYQTEGPLIDNLGFTAAYAFLTELSPAGAVVYSTYFGSNVSDCDAGSFCIGKYGLTTGTAIALDASGDVTIAGNTNSSGLPTTTGVMGATCTCGWDYSYGTDIDSGFVARFRPSAAQQLVWSTYLNATYSPYGVGVGGMALDSAGNVILGGRAATGLPTTSLTWGGTYPNVGAFLLEMSSNGSAVVWGTYLIGQDAGVQAVVTDAQGRIVFGGSTGTASFVGRVPDDGITLTDFYTGPAGGTALAITSTGGFASIVPAGALWIETASAGPSLLNIANSATGLYVSSAYTTELISLYGVGIGPQIPLTGVVQNGVYTTSLGGYQVLFNGTAAPLLYAGSGQINAVVPSGASASTQIQVVTPSGTIDGPALGPPSNISPGIFQNGQTGLAAALNQDGSINSASNPASAGTIVTVFANANSGQYFPDGTVVPLGIYTAGVTVWVVDSNRSLEVVWAGAAPGIVNGVMQINFLLPETLPQGNTFAFSVVIGGASTAQNYVAVAQ
jgi:uncharacterized protein (TIGR03437 family)